MRRLYWKLVTIALLSLSTSCATTNHGTTLPKGASQLAVTGQVSSLVQSGLSAEYRHGLTDEVTVAVSTQVGVGAASIGSSLYYGLDLGSVTVVPGLGLHYAQRYFSEASGSEQGYFVFDYGLLPDLSVAASVPLGEVTRSYVGIQSSLVVSKLYVGIEQTFGTMTVFGDAQYSFAGLYGILLSVGLSHPF